MKTVYFLIVTRHDIERVVRSFDTISQLRAAARAALSEGDQIAAYTGALIDQAKL